MSVTGTGTGTASVAGRPAPPPGRDLVGVLVPGEREDTDEVHTLIAGTSTPTGLLAHRRADGRVALVGTPPGDLRVLPPPAALLACPPVVAAAILPGPDRHTAVVLLDHRRLPATSNGGGHRVAPLRERIGHTGATRILQFGVGDSALPAALSRQTEAYWLADPSTTRVCDVLSRRPDLRRRLRVVAAPTASAALAAARIPGGPDLVLVDLLAPTLSTADVVSQVVDALAVVAPRGAVFVANLRDPRVERLANWTATGRATSVPDAGGWSPPAFLRALDRRAPGATARAYPPLGEAPHPAAYDVVLRPGTSSSSTPTPLRWGRELETLAQIDRLLAPGRLTRARLVGLPLVRVEEARESWLRHLGRRRRTPARPAPDWRAVVALAAEHGYLATPVASLTGAEHRVDVLFEPDVDGSGRAGGTRSWVRSLLKRELGGRFGPLDVVIVDRSEGWGRPG